MKCPKCGGYLELKPLGIYLDDKHVSFIVICLNNFEHEFSITISQDDLKEKTVRTTSDTFDKGVSL